VSVIEQTNEGLANADVYCSVDRADAWLSTSRIYTKWEAKETDEKEKLLLLATSYLDSYYVWYGAAVLPAPSLRWPRTKIYDLDNRLLAGIPVEIRYSCAEIALYFMTNDPFADSSSFGIENIELDVIKIKFDSSVSQKVKLPQSVLNRLSPYGYPIGSIGASRRSGKVIAS
jgi:hypothetical protein